MFKLTDDSLSNEDQEMVICLANYHDVPAGASIPRSHRWFQTYLKWLTDSSGSPPVPHVVESAETFDAVKARLIEEVKHDAGKMIVEQYPEWKQRNLIARGLELSRIETPTTEEQAEIDAIDAVWSWVKTVRANSDTAEANINTLNSQAELDATVLPIRMSDF